MNKKNLIILFSLLIATSANSQITKGNWMVGGSGIYSKQTYNSFGKSVKSTNLNIAPNIGYFFSNKLCSGLKSDFGWSNIDNGYTALKENTIKIGPFARYYFLGLENRVNILSEVSYLYQKHLGYTSNLNEDDNFFTISAGPVIFLNSSVGLELTLNYQIYTTPSTTLTDVRTLFASIGFQIHLEKEK